MAMSVRSRYRLALVVGAVLSAAVACGGSGDGSGSKERAPELVATWDLVSIESEGIVGPCPGEIVLSPTSTVSCGTEELILAGDGSLVEIQTTDENGDPLDRRTEGTWSTQADMLEVIELREGPDAGSLMPIDPPNVVTSEWMIDGSGETLTLSIDPPLGPRVAGVYDKR